MIDDISLLREALDRVPPDPNRCGSLSKLANALSTRFEQEGQSIDLDEAISFHRQALELRLPPHPNRSDSLNDLAAALLTRFEQGGQQTDLDEAIPLCRQALELRPPPHPDRSTSLNNLADVLFTRFQQGDQLVDLDEAISLFRQALELRLPPDPNRDYSLNALAFALSTRFKLREGQEIDLDEAISLHRKALELLLPPHPHHSISLNNLASALWTRFKQGGRQIDLDETVALFKQVLELQLPPHPDRSILLNNLGSALLTRFKQGGQQIDFDEAISLFRQALELQPPPHPRRSSSLNNLASALLTQFEQGDQQIDLDEAISLFRQALELQLPPHPNRSHVLSNLGSALLTRFEQAGQQTDLDEAISLLKQAFEFQPTTHDLDRSSMLSNLAHALEIRFRQEGHQIDLDEAISLLRQALREPRFSPNPAQSNLTLNLASTLLTRFEQGGQQIDLDEAISLHRQALEFRPPHHPERWTTLNNLANTLLIRFDQGGQSIDLDEAISLQRQALELQLPTHHDRSTSLNTLACVLGTRYKKRSQQTDFDEAISLYRQALELELPPNPKRSLSLHNLACLRRHRFEKEGQQIDLDEAISLHRQALELRLPPHPDRFESLRNLADTLSVRFQKAGQRIDLEEAIYLQRQAPELQPSLHPSHSESLDVLGTLLVYAHELRLPVTNGLEHLDEAMSLFLAATQGLFISPSRRLYYAQAWAYFAEKHQHISALNAYDVALQALPQVAALSFDIQSRHDVFATHSHSDGLARNASRCAISAGNLDKAIEFLEAGQSIFWSQVLSLRSSFDQLHDIAPELEAKLKKIAAELELASYRDVSGSVNFFDNQKKLSIHEETSRLNRLHEEWVKCIDEVRKLEGLENFQRPLPLSSLKSAASKHPVVILVAHLDGSHCLIMTSTGVHHIPLPNLHIPWLKALVRVVQDAVYQLPVSRSTIERLGEERGMRLLKEGKLKSPDDIFRYVLRRLWDDLVKLVIKTLDIQKMTKSDPNEMPILQWCPTGLFTFLPIHAAGYYDEQDIECAADYFISSYTPTVGALLPHSPPSRSTRTPFKMMVVIQTEKLFSTEKELENIQKHVSNDALVIFGVPGTVANVETVASRLSEASIVHFACHGKQDRKKSLDSGLTLDDGLLRISRIMKERSLDGSLAFLCACETAMGDGNLPDEAMSLGASLLFSGFRSVIATMWEMVDRDGPTMADTFYEELFRGPDGKPALEPDTTKSAQALHVAVQKLRSRNISFGRWIPFIHIGK